MLAVRCVKRLVIAICLALLPVAPLDAAEWHVDPAGDDAAAGDLAAPLRTIQQAVRLVSPGDTVVVHPGTYVESVDLTVSGTAEAPITVRALPGAVLVAPPVEGSWEGIDVAAGTGHLVIEGVHVAGFAESILLRAGAHDIVLRDCLARAGTVGLWIGGATRVTVERCVLIGNRRGLRISGAASAVTIADTYSLGNDDGLGCDGDADGFTVEESVHTVAFHRCVAAGNSEDGFDLQGDGMLVAQSESRDNGCSGLKLAQHARVENTLVAGNRTGIATSSYFGAPVVTELINNTIADNTGVQLLLRARTVDPAAPATVVLRNLIVAGPGKLLEAEWPLALVEDHNLFFRPDTTSGAIVRHGPAGERRYSGQAINTGVWAAESGLGAGTIAVDPGFLDRQQYAVAADSAAVDRGSAAGAPALDRAGAVRPAGAAVDIGRDEAAAASGNHAPWADPGPDRVVRAGAAQLLLAFGSIDPDGDALTCTWDPGDGSAPVAGCTASHTWAAPGAYTLTLTVSDGTRTHSRGAAVQVEAPPTATPSPVPTPTATPPEVAHDSRVRAPRGRIRLRIRPGRAAVTKRVAIQLANADVAPARERPGHAIRLDIDLGDCAPALDVTSTSVGSAGIVVAGGRRARATIRLTADADAVHTPDRRSPLRCTAWVHARGPGSDPTPADNRAPLHIEIRDDNDRE